MDIENIEKKLKKINSVLEIFKEDGRLTKIEKDLLMGYIRELYDSICFVEDEQIVAPTNQIMKQVGQSKQNPIDDVINTAPIIDAVPKNIEDKIRPAPIVPEESIFSTLQEKVTDEIIKPAGVDKPIIAVESREAPTQMGIEGAEVLIKSTTSQVINHPELIELFADDDYTDMSDKLSMTKIDQISTSIGINARFYMINELFNGDGNLFSKILVKLDEVGSLEGAKDIILNEVAIPMNWVENNKLVAAEDFIKLIKRRYK